MKPSRPPEIELFPDESIDHFMDGRLKLIQSRTGYRFSIDAILLSEFVTIKKGDTVVDLGIGCGIIPLLLLLTRPVRFAFGLEIQAGLAHQACRNALLNGFSHKMSVIQGDIRHPPLSPSSADVVMCNPPYRKKDSGRINPDQQRAIARHEILASLDDILSSARYILRAKGRLAMIYPAERLADVMIRMRRFGIEPKRVRIIYPNLESEAKLAMVEASLGGRGGLKILPPLMDQGDYTIQGQA
ncbi:tRNA1(Val) (adenine(37)-N6)-methyltransferase [Thermodesulfobacteriota bacterium]